MNNKIKPYWSFIIEALAVDYEPSGLSWAELLKDIFIDETNTYSVMYRLLVHVGIDPNKKINKEETLTKMGSLVTTYEVIEKEGNLEILIHYDKSTHPLPSKDEINKALEAIGYKEIPEFMN